MTNEKIFAKLIRPRLRGTIPLSLCLLTLGSLPATLPSARADEGEGAPITIGKPIVIPEPKPAPKK